METTVEFTFRKVVEHAKAVDNYCREHNCIRIMTALFGSQNYGLDEATSDIDTKSIVVPAVDDWLWNTEGDSNHLIIMPDGSHAEMRPVVSMFKQFLKGNINFLEILYTPYLDIADGCACFKPLILKKSEFFTDGPAAGSLSFTWCGTPVTYKLTNDSSSISINGKKREGNTLTKSETADLFARNGKIKEIEVSVCQA